MTCAGAFDRCSDVACRGADVAAVATSTNTNFKKISIKSPREVMFLIFLVCSRKFSGASSLYLGTLIVE